MPPPEQLRRQLTFLKLPCTAYDAGHRVEALRIAVCLRVLFHDTKRSISLLTQLNITHLKIPSTLGTGRNLQQLAGKTLVHLPLMISQEGVMPPLDSARINGPLPADEWWNEIVMVQREPLSRRDIVLAAANQDGGAHVDPTPGPELTELRAGLGTLTIGDASARHTIELTDHHFPLLRQFGHDVLQCDWEGALGY